MTLSLPLATVQAALAAVDAPDDGGPSSLHRSVVDLLNAVLDRAGSNSDKVALLFLLAYKRLVPAHDLQWLPKGWRPADKQLAEGLTVRHITLHGRITSPGENMGSKGQASAFNLFGRRYLGDALQHFQAHPEQVHAGLHYVAKRFQNSYVAPIEIEVPPPGSLVYARAYDLCCELLRADSGGHYPQFLVASLLKELHEQWGTRCEITTQHPNAADKSSKTAGDIEVRSDTGDLLEAFEVTMRPDWKNRRADFVKKMDEYGLDKYTILCPTREDPDVGTPGALAAYMDDVPRDIAVVDIGGFISVTVQSLNRENRERVLEHLVEYVQDPAYCGIPDLETLLQRLLAKRIQVP